MTWVAYGSRWPTVIDQVNQWDEFLFRPEAGPEGFASLLRAYGWTHTDELDLAVAHAVRFGYDEDGRVRTALQQAHEMQSVNNLQEAFTSAWERFHGSFDTDPDQFPDDLYASALAAVAVISPMNLESTVRLLRQLDREAEANHLVDQFIETHGDQPQMLDLRAQGNMWGHRFEDDYLIDRMQQAMQRVAVRTTPMEALSRRIENGVFDSAGAAAIRALSADDFVELFLGLQGNSLRLGVNACMEFNHPPDAEAVRANVREALTTIGRRNGLNRLQVRRYGIDV